MLDPRATVEWWDWSPGVEFPGAFADDWAIRLTAYRTLAGDRMFIPFCGWESLVRTAGAAGIEVARRAGLPAAVTRPHAVMLIAHEYATRRAEFLSRSFRTRDELRGRDPDVCLVLPPGVTGSGEREDADPSGALDAFLRRGRAAAVRGGTPDPPPPSASPGAYTPPPPTQSNSRPRRAV